MHVGGVYKRAVTALLAVRVSIPLSVCVCTGALTDVRDNSGKRPRDVAKKTISSRSRGMLRFDLDDSVPSTTR